MNKLSVELMEQFADIYREHLDYCKTKVIEKIDKNIEWETYQKDKAKDLEDRLRKAGIRLERS